MSESASPSRSPLTLIASGQEWSARSFDSILGPNGYSVLRAYTGAQALERARGAQADIIIIDSMLPDMMGLDVCRQLRRDRDVNPATPIFITTAGPTARHERLEALRAGAWDLFGLPLDSEEILLKFRTYMTAKFDADRAREESLLDQMTGLYNVRGLLRRVRELGSEAFRYNRPLACIVFAPEDDAGSAEVEEPAELLERLAEVFRKACRVSDAVGRLGPSEFVVLAPDTDPNGAMRLAERVATAAEAKETDSPARDRLRVGYYAVPNFREASIEPVDMLVRATMALRRTQSAATDRRIEFFDPSSKTSLS